MNRTLIRALVLSLVLVVNGSAATAPKTVKLLTIGNSFSGNATHYLGDIAKAGGNTLVHTPMSIGGAAMEVHWDHIQANEKDPADPKGLYGAKALNKTLESEAWDYVTIQQASIKSHDVDTYRPFAAQLQEYVKKHAPKAELLIHQTWAYRRDDPRFGPKNTKADPATSEVMYTMSSAAYITIAKELGVRRIPVGDAFHMADSDPEWGYKVDEKFDRAKAMPPDLPDQTHSLHAGWRWVKSKDGAKTTLEMDGHHAGVAGEYLGACVWYEFLFKEPVAGNTFLPKGLTREEADYLQKVAHRAVEALK